MEKIKKINVLKILIIILCLMLFIGLILPYESAIGEYKEYLEKNPDKMNIKEVNLANKDAVNISIIENFQIYSYGMNNSGGNSWLAQESTINYVLIIILIASSILVLVFTVFNKRVLSIIFDILVFISSIMMNFDIVSRGVIPSSKYTYGISYYLYPIIAVIILVSIIAQIVINKKSSSVK